MKLGFLFLFILLIVGFQCKEDNPVSPPQNQSPQILSLVVFPTLIDFNDSVIVSCNAIDPDGDTIVYDWHTDGRIRIKGTDNYSLYHTSEMTHIFYPRWIREPRDTCWIMCGVRDVKGGEDLESVEFIVVKNLGVGKRGEIEKF
jgi:hypothetical protein